MKKIILPDILEIYWADGEKGNILGLNHGHRQKKAPSYEKGRDEGRVWIHFKDGKHKKYKVGYLILIAYDGFRDLRVWDYIFKNGNPHDTRYCNLEWQERLNLSNIFTDDEWNLYVQAQAHAVREANVNFNIHIYRKIKQAGAKLLKNSDARREFFNDLFKIKKLRMVDDTGLIDFSQDINGDLTDINENKF